MKFTLYYAKKWKKKSASFTNLHNSFCVGKGEDKVDWHKLVILDSYIPLILKGRKKTHCDFSLYTNFNRMFGFDQNISICFSEAENWSKRIRFQQTHQPSTVPRVRALTLRLRGRGTVVWAGLWVTPAKSGYPSASDSTARPGKHSAHWKQNTY